MLVSDDIISKLPQDSVELPSGESLLSSLNSYGTPKLTEKWGFDKSIYFTLELIRLSKNKTIMQILDSEFLAHLPKLVKYKGQGKKVFELFLPPFSLRTKGFGLLGRDVNFYAFHSVIALIHFLGQKYSDNEVFLKQLVQVAERCGSAYVFNQISTDQLALANTILKEVGIS